MKRDKLFISKFDFEDYKGFKRVDRDEKDWTYHDFTECVDCDHKQIIELTKDEYEKEI